MKIQEGIKKIAKSKSKAFFTLCFCFILGVGFSSLLELKLQFYYFYFCFFVVATFFIIFWKNIFVRFLIFCLLSFIFGIARYIVAFPDVSNKEQITSYYTQTVDIIGVVDEEPDIRTDGVRYIIQTENLKLKTQNLVVEGKIYLKSGLYPRYEYGDILVVKCFLSKPEPIEDFRYDMYLARYGVFTVCESQEINKIQSGDGNFILQSIFVLKSIFAGKINLLWHEPHASFMAGLLYGYRGGLGSLNELFSRTGVTHIVAISGYNIAIVATILVALSTYVYIPRKRAFWAVFGGIVLFVIFAGASASVVRAGIMGIVVLLAKRLGRMSRIGNVMILTAALMTLQNPFVLLWDAGFQLSFISTLGLVYLTPLIEPYFKKMPETFGIKEILISTFSAIIATLPLILYQFGRLSVVAPVVNILILWLLPWLMLTGFFAVMISFIFFPLAQVIAWTSWAGLSYIILVVKWFSGLPFAAVNIIIPAWLMILIYCGMIYGVYKRRGDKK